MDIASGTAGALLEKAKETVSFAHVSGDVAIFLGLTAFFFLYVVYYGREEGLANVFALLLTGFLLVLFPYWEFLEKMKGFPLETEYVKLSVFFFLFFLVRHIMKKFIAPGYGGLNLHTVMETTVLATAMAGLLLAYGFELFGLSNFYSFGIPFFKFLFMTKEGLFLTCAYGMGAMMLIRRLQGA